MANEQMSQDEIDSLLKNINSGELDIDSSVLSGGEDRFAYSRITTAMDRLQFAQENGMNSIEIRYRRWYLHDAAYSLWLKHHGYTRQEWQEKVRQHFILHPEHYQLFLQKKTGRQVQI